MADGEDVTASGWPPDWERLDRYPPVFSATAEIPAHQLGWRAAVLPFRSMGSPAGYGIALGMAEEISAAISRFRSPRLIAPVTFWNGTGPSVDALGRCRLYNLDYILEGVIRVGEETLRVDVTLSDVTLNFEVIWTARFHGRLDELFSLQERIAMQMVAELDPDLHELRGDEAEEVTPPGVATAHRAVLTAISHIFRDGRSKFLRARDLLTEAIRLDPRYAAAHAWLAYWSVIAVARGWVADPQDVVALAAVSADKALQLDPNDGRALAVAGHVKSYLLHDVREALRLHARATEVAPNLHVAWAFSAWSRIYNGEHGTALRHARTAQALSPRDPHGFIVDHAMMTAYLFRRELEDAETIAEVVLGQDPANVTALHAQLAILGHMGRTGEASEVVGTLLAARPDATVASVVARAPLRPADLAYYREGLLLAGMPAGSDSAAGS